MTFSEYLRRHFAQTKWPEAFGIGAGILAAPVLSLCKPALGWLGLAAVWLSVLAFAAVWGGVYVAVRAAVYYVGKRRQVLPNAKSWTAGLTGLAAWALAPLTLLLIVESFYSSHGVLADSVPQFQEEQQKWFAAEKAPATPSDPEISEAPAEEENPFVLETSEAETSPFHEETASPSNPFQQEENPFQ